MKAFYVMFVVFAVLLFAAPMASAQDGGAGLGCPPGYAYSLVRRGYPGECLPEANSAVSAASKSVGLAQPAPALAAKQDQARPGCPGGSAYDMSGHGCVTGYSNDSAATESSAPKAAGLAVSAQAAKQDQGWPGCPWGAAYDPMEHGFIAECFFKPTDNAAALKPAGLAKPAPAVIPEQGWPGCPWGAAYDPIAHGYVPECFSRPTDNAAALKPAGLAKLAPVEVFAPCGFGEQLDPLLDPLALACLSQSFPAAKAASKPAGLAAPTPVALPEQGLSCPPWGDSYDPMMLSYGPECLSRPADNAASLKPAGLAQLAPVEAFVPCGLSESLDPLLDPLALACLSQPVPAAKAASKPAGLAALTQAVQQNPEVQGCAFGYADYFMSSDYVPDCLSRSADNAAAPKPAGLAKLVPVEKFVPCGYGERLDPLALACQSLSTSAVEAEAKPAGLAQHAPQEQFTSCGFGERLDPLALACLH